MKTNREDEMEILSSYDDIMESELIKTNLEVKIILDFFPDNLKPIPEFNNSALYESSKLSFRTIVMSFKAIAKQFQIT